MKLWGFVDGECKDLYAEIELLKGYRDKAESDAAIARLALEKVRLTVEEQEAVQRAIDTLNTVQDIAPSATAADAMAAWRLGQLLKRLA